MLLELFPLYLYSYLIGAIPTSYLIVRLVKGIDLRQYGSGNVGGSNLAQQVGRKWVALLALLEFLFKGASPVLLGLFLASPSAGMAGASFPVLAAPLLALVGNNWSIFLRFQGGRGLMVICGMLAALVPLLLLAGLLIYLVGWRASRSSGPWALLAMALLPLLALAPGGWLTIGWAGLLALMGNVGVVPSSVGEPGVISWFCVFLLAIVILKRLTSNSLAFPSGLPRRKVLFNRLFRDRDVDSRAEWLGRVPGEC